MPVSTKHISPISPYKKTGIGQRSEGNTHNILWLGGKWLTRSANNSQETGNAKRVLLGTDEISFTFYNDLGLEKDAMTLTVMPHIGFTGKIKQTVGEVVLHVYAEGGNMSTNLLVINYASSYNVMMRHLWIHDMGAVPSTLPYVVKFLLLLPENSQRQDQGLIEITVKASGSTHKRGIG
ncbi:hypothetical protein F2Q70_00031235 [Brassica cretica]|uniref:Uncharacterized protein n=1 Tax=Brassica cretica TaxID=69181 RepID=A0A8S9FGJ4_BRACR|nr:hypothetical protein F2Q70_00031235 [Brassica cretica]